MSWFCKHEWDYVKAQRDYHLQDYRICGKQHPVTVIRCGVLVYCTKCGKQHRRLSKKLGRLYTTHLANEMKHKAKEITNKSDIVEVKVDISKYLGNK